jgi:hypothetical protein
MKLGIGTAFAAFVYVTYGLITDTGAAGWLNYLQQSMTGSYSMGLTYWALLMAVAAIGIATQWIAMVVLKEDKDEA